MLADVVDELESAGIALHSQGALCGFDPEVIGPDDAPVPLMLRKSDGGYGYDTTDLATLRHRVQEPKADRILWVVLPGSARSWSVWGRRKTRCRRTIRS